MSSSPVTSTLRHISFRRIGTSDVHQRFLEDDRDLGGFLGMRARNVQELLRRAPTGAARLLPRDVLVKSLRAYAHKVPHYLTGAQIRAEWERRHPGRAWPAYDPGGMITNLFLKPPGWRAAEGFGQPALGYPR